MTDAEPDRIARVYADRQRRLPPGYYSVFNPGNLYIVQRRERAALRLLADHGLTDLSDLEILDVGCGAATEMLRLVGWGATPARMAGVDLLPGRIEQARERLGHARFEVSDARSLPFEDGRFDLLLQFTVFSSVVDPAFRQQIAAEMLRVLKPGGSILWYDMRVVHPGRDLVAVSRAEISCLFPGCTFDVRTETLLPTIARRLARVSWCLCDLLSLLPILRSHYLAIIRKTT